MLLRLLHSVHRKNLKIQKFQVFRIIAFSIKIKKQKIIFSEN